MRLLPRAADMWQQASLRFALNLVPFRVLARPLAPISAALPHIKCLHDDVKKKPDSVLEQEINNSPDNDQIKLEAEDSAADSESAPERAASEAPEDDAQITAVQNGKR